MIIKSGPIFDLRAQMAAIEAGREIEQDLARRGAAMVRTRQIRTFRRETPYYRLHVKAMENRPGWKVTDQGVVYGHWLEGDGSRNFPVTRFRGYHIFRTVTGQLNTMAKSVGDAVVAKYIRAGRMG